MPDAHREALARHLEDCGRLAPGFRWVEPDALHLTLRFLGSLEPDVLERVGSELREVRPRPFRLAIGGQGTFGPRRSPRVVWIGVTEGLEQCAALAASVEAACARAGLEP